MAYNLELAKNKPIQNLLANKVLEENLDTIEFIVSENEYVRIDDYCLNKNLKPKDFNIKNIFVIDGSKFDGHISHNMDNHITILNINESYINLEKMINYLKSSFPLPNEYFEIKKDYSNFLIVPFKGFRTKEINDDRDFFRFYFYNHFKQLKNVFFEEIKENIKNEESIFDTYKLLVGNSKKTGIDAVHPCPVCREKFKLNAKSFENSDIINCHCENNSKKIYITDLLQFHELLNTENSNEILSTQIMLVLEKLFLLNLIRNLSNNNLKEIIEESAFILDGTLSIYYHATWLSNLIAQEIYKLKQENSILICSVEKSGNFNQHFQMLENYFKEEPLKNNLIYFLNDNYIKKYIKIYHNDNFYGEKNYFGKKFFYKNKLGKLFVLNLAYENEADKYRYFNERNEIEQINKCDRLEDLCMLLDNFSSNNYENALSFISMANEGASLSNSKIGSKILNEFLNNLFRGKNN
jgi:hypothetical protein